MKFCTLVAAFYFLLSPVKGQLPNHDSSFKIVGYYSLQSASHENAGNVPFNKLTHINLYFLNPDSLGNFKDDYPKLISFVNEAHAKNVKVSVSIGGGGRHPYYAKLLKDSRTKLIDDLVSITLRYNLDGIDVDIEGSDIDENYDNFVIELATSLHLHNKIITAAVAVFYQNDYTDKVLAQYDFVNLMSYDHTGPWAPGKPGPHATYDHAVEDLAYFRTIRNIPREKITLGVPFYGYGFGPKHVSQGISMNYNEIVTSFPGAEFKDEFDMGDSTIMYYNGMPTIKMKTILAKRQASGIKIWQLSGDAAGSMSLLNEINEVAKEHK